MVKFEVSETSLSIERTETLKGNLQTRVCRVRQYPGARAVSRARNFRILGPDSIIAFWWRSCPLHTEPELCCLVEDTILIPKKGELIGQKNYRPIACLNTLYKIFTSLIDERVLSYIEFIWENVYARRGPKGGLAGCKINLLIHS